MFKSYLLLAWKVLLRRKVFSFISLFGISMTLAILLIVTTIFDNYLHPNGPEKNNNNYLAISDLSILSEDGRNESSSNLGFWFLSNNVSRLQIPEKMSFFTKPNILVSYIGNDSLSKNMRRTDANYWEILSFNFSEGRAFTQQEFEQGAKLAVISKTTSREYFPEQSAINQTLSIGNQTFTVIGVVDDVSFLEHNAYSHIWTPYTTLPSSNYRDEMLGRFNALLYHSNANMLAQIQAEYSHLLSNNFATNDPETYHTATSRANTPIEALASEFIGTNDNSEVSVMFTFVAFLALGFMALPSINLINLNVSRIMERASEIGVRKAFGASSKQLVMQFVIENIVITAVGGVIAFLLSFGVLTLVESQAFMQGTEINFSLYSFIYGLSLVLIFGFLSGVYPAYKMSKLHPVTALKGGV